eukprot:gene17747-19521_t
MAHYIERSQDDGYFKSENDGSASLLLEGEGECELHNTASSFLQNDEINDAESGVGPDVNDWIYRDTTENVEFDITAEQAMATLQYFSEYLYT